MNPVEWPDTTAVPAPVDHLYRSATWLLGRHPRLATLAARIRDVVDVEDGELTVDLDHLAQVIASVPAYERAWQDYAATHREPADDRDWDRWRDAGPTADSITPGLSDFLVMSSGEVASLRLLATLAWERTLFRVSDVASLDTEGQRLLADWTHAVRTAYGVPHGVSTQPRLNLGDLAPTVEGRTL